jgi:hypothetical protein
MRPVNAKLERSFPGIASGAQFRSVSLLMKEMTMRIPTLIFAATLCVLPLAASADGGEAQYDFLNQPGGASTLTRAEVRKSLAAAFERGELPIGERGYVFKIEPSTRTRAEVLAEAREAGRLGLLPREAWPLSATPDQQAQIRAAGQAARLMAEAAQKR